MVKQKEKEIYIREIKKKKKKRPYKKNKRRNEIGKCKKEIAIIVKKLREVYHRRIEKSRRITEEEGS